MSQEIPEIPATADELLNKIDESKANTAEKPVKTEDEIGQQISRIARRLVDRAEQTGPDIHRKYDHLGLRAYSGEDVPESLSLVHYKNGKKTEKKELRTDTPDMLSRISAGEGKVEVRWRDDTGDQSVKVSEAKRPFRKPVHKLSTNLVTDEGYTENAPVIKEDIAEVAKVLEHTRGALSKHARNIAEENERQSTY